jgi:outer membrane protein
MERLKTLPMVWIIIARYGSLLILLLAFASMKLSAQESQEQWSLEDCINYALDNNIDIKKQLLAVKMQEEDHLQSKLNLLPNLNAGGNHVYNWGQTVDRYTNTFATNRVQSNNFYLSTNFTLFSGLQKFNTMKQNELNVEASQYDLDYMMDDISVAVSGYYLDILFNEELLEVAVRQLEVTQQQVDRMQKMVEAGTLAKGDLLNIQAQEATEQLQVVELENALQISYLNLMQLIDYPVSEDFVIEKPELKSIEAPSISISSDEIYNVALQKRPEIKSAELRVESAEKDISIARSYLSPVLSLTGTWATGYSGLQSEPTGDPVIVPTETPIGFTASEELVYGYDIQFPGFETVAWDEQIRDNNNRSVGLTLQIPIFNGWQVRNAINKAKIARQEADYNLKQTQLELNKTIQQAYADAVAALNNYNAAEEKVEAQQEAFKYAEQRFDVGLLNSVEYNDTKQELTRAESELLQAKYNYIFTTTILDFYMGKPLSITN